MTKEHLQKIPSIDDEFYKQYSQVYEYALKMVEKEIHQSVEGMYHK